MAIDTGLLVACGDMNAVGGIRQILLTDLSNIATALPTTAANHTLTSFIGLTLGLGLSLKMKLHLLQ